MVLGCAPGIEILLLYPRDDSARRLCVAPSDPVLTSNTRVQLLAWEERAKPGDLQSCQWFGLWSPGDQFGVQVLMPFRRCSDSVRALIAERGTAPALMP